MAKSKAEADLDSALREVFGPTAVTTEKTVKVRGRSLYVDRLMAGLMLAFEVDGRQHRDYVEFFHGSKDGFKDAKERDALKEHWLRAAGYTLVRFSHTEKITPALVRDKVRAALQKDEDGD